MPFEMLCNVVLFVTTLMPLERALLKIIPVADMRTNKKSYFTLGQYSDLPHNLLLDPVAKAGVKRIVSTTKIGTLFGFVRTPYLYFVQSENKLHQFIKTGLPNPRWSFLQW